MWKKKDAFSEIFCARKQVRKVYQFDKRKTQKKGSDYRSELILNSGWSGIEGKDWEIY